jgi:hypothetical protein
MPEKEYVLQGECPKCGDTVQIFKTEGLEKQCCKDFSMDVFGGSNETKPNPS